MLSRTPYLLALLELMGRCTASHVRITANYLWGGMCKKWFAYCFRTPLQRLRQRNEMKQWTSCLERYNHS